jgi:hypothetical protein
MHVHEKGRGFCFRCPLEGLSYASTHHEAAHLSARLSYFLLPSCHHTQYVRIVVTEM